MQIGTVFITLLSGILETMKETTKQCPNCGNDRLILLRTQNKKACVDCHTLMGWYLEPGQKGVGYSATT